MANNTTINLNNTNLAANNIGTNLTAVSVPQAAAGPQHLTGDRVYAVCTKDAGDYLFFTLQDGTGAYFSIPARYFGWQGMTVQQGSGIWGLIDDPGDGQRLDRVRVIRERKESLYPDLKWLLARYEVGDTIRVPVTAKTTSYVEVNLTATLKHRIGKEDFADALVFDDFRTGTVEDFTISRLEEKADGRIEVRLAPCRIHANRNPFWELLPEDLDHVTVNVSGHLTDHLDETVRAKLPGLGDPVQPEELKAAVAAIYRNRYSEHAVCAVKRGSTLYMNFTLGFENENGVPEEVYMKKEAGRDWGIALIGPTKPMLLMERFVMIPEKDRQRMVDELDALCLSGENWDFGSDGPGEKKILKDYLYLTFYKAWIDGLVTENENGAVFNTGLVDNAYDDIYCYLEPNSGSDFCRRKWKFGYFACPGKDVRGKQLYRSFEKLPPAPVYIEEGRRDTLFFDTGRELYCDYDHIIMDNVERLPYEFLFSKLSYDPEVFALTGAYEQESDEEARALILGQIYALIRAEDAEGERRRRELQDGLKMAVERAKKYCRWNYKTATPVYFAKTNSISLLIPLKLRQQKEVLADVALVVERLENGNYQGQTIFTMKMAYQDARQICRPAREWLVAGEIGRRG